MCKHPVKGDDSVGGARSGRADGMGAALDVGCVDAGRFEEIPNFPASLNSTPAKSRRTPASTFFFFFAVCCFLLLYELGQESCTRTALLVAFLLLCHDFVCKDVLR